MGEFDNILAKHEDDGAMPLTEHLKSVAETAVVFARYAGFDTDTAYKGAILHDIGKVSPVFQQTLTHGYSQQPGFVFRHEIASLFFISLLPENQRPAIIDMIVAHHKSIYKDVREKGLLDLDENMDSFARHSEKFEEWSKMALDILKSFGFETHPISIDEAQDNYEFAVDYCYDKQLNCAEGKGLLLAAHHFASSS